MSKHSSGYHGETKECHIEIRSVEEGYFALAAAIINQAVLDYRHLRFTTNELSGMKKEERRKEWEDSRDFLFTDKIRHFCKEFGIIEVINVDKIRKLARGLL